MSYVGRVIHCPDTESLIRKYLQSGVMTAGKYEPTEKGTPQGGTLSPLLSNIMLNDLDKEHQKRGLRYVRYADDCVIAVGSRASANRVMYSITDWIERKLGLRVNAEKTHISRPTNLKYLGFIFWKAPKATREGYRVEVKTPRRFGIEVFRGKLKQLCKRSWSVSMNYRLSKLNPVIRGWINYFSMSSMRQKMEKADKHLRTMLRKVIRKQWKTPTEASLGTEEIRD